jgi:hypothetical protein
LAHQTQQQQQQQQDQVSCRQDILLLVLPVAAMRRS